MSPAGASAWAPARLDRPRVGDRVPHHRRQVGLGQVEGGRAVQPRQLQQFGHERAHPLRLLLDPAHRVRQLIGPERPLPVQLGVAADGRQRGAQLVRGVRRELADLLLGLQPGAEGLLDPVQHGVDGPAQPAHLGALVGVGHACGEVALGGDPVRGAGHLAERRQPTADEPSPADHEQQDQHTTGDQLGHDHAAHLPGHRRDRPGDHEQGHARREGGRVHLAGAYQPLHRPHPGPVRQHQGERLAGQVLDELGPAHLAERLLQLVAAGARGEQGDLPGAAGERGGQIAAGVAGQGLRVARRRGHQVGVELPGQPAGQHQGGDAAHDQQERGGDGDEQNQQAGAQRQPPRAAHQGGPAGPAGEWPGLAGG